MKYNIRHISLHITPRHHHHITKWSLLNHPFIGQIWEASLLCLCLLWNILPLSFKTHQKYINDYLQT